MKMADVFANTLVSYLTKEAKHILDHLNARKLFRSEGPGRPPRDVRGLAVRIGLTTQEAENQTVQSVLQTWAAREVATVGQLLRHLAAIDRYDVSDDLLALAAANRLVRIKAYTKHELKTGVPQTYDALVIYAEKDEKVVDKICDIMGNIGFSLIKKQDLRAGEMQLHAMTELMTTRCRYTIIMFSPAFRRSHDDIFYSQYAHARKVADQTHGMIPCILRPCTLPKEFIFYSVLHANKPRFYEYLATNLNYGRNPSIPIQKINTVLHQTSNSLPIVRINWFVGDSHSVNSIPDRTETTGLVANNSSSQTDAFATKSQTASETSDQTEVIDNRQVVSRSQHILVNRQTIDEYPFRDETTRFIANQSSQHTNAIVPDDQMTSAALNQIEATRQTSCFQSTNPFITNGVTNNISDRASFQHSNQFTDASNGSVGDQVIMNCVANSQIVRFVAPQPANGYVAEIGNDEHSYITDQQYDCNESSISNLEDRSADGHPIRFIRSFVDLFEKWYRDKRLWMRRRQLFQKRPITVQAR